MNKVNPTALLLSANLMVEHLGFVDMAKKLDLAISKVISDGKEVTYDLGGKTGMREMGQAIVSAFKKI
jgi:isocitrate dehydrogenase (NAD+)